MMRRSIFLAAIAFIGLSTGSIRAKEHHHPAPRQLAVENDSSLSYLLYLPPEYNESPNKWPLLLFLHGSGERGNNLDWVKSNGPPKMIAEGQDFPFLVVSPQCPSKGWWNNTELNLLLDKIIAAYRVDTNRIYVTGLSMGGYGTWGLAQASPERIAAIVPICGGGNPDKAKRIKDIPAWVFHGAKDTSVNLSESEKMVDALRAAGGNVKFTVYRHAEHADTWEKAYKEKALWKWLIRQKKPEKQPPPRK